MTEQIIKDCISALACPLGKFYPDKNYGSRLNGQADINSLLCAARLAVNNIDGVYIKNGKTEDNKLILSVLINENEERTVIIDLDESI